MKVGILGTGFGTHHAKIYKKLDSVESITIFGRNKEKLRQLEEELNVNVTPCADEILTNKDIDLIDICLPTPLHKEYVIEALKNGKDVFCETPVALSLEDALAMREAQKQYGKKVFVNQFIKSEFPYAYVQEHFQKKTLGKLIALHIRRKTPPFWGDLSLSRITTDFMIHEFDFITWLLGIPDTLSAAGINVRAKESHADVLLTYKDAIVEVQSSSMMPRSHAFTVGYEAIFEEGAVEYVENGYADRCEASLQVFHNDHSEEIPIAAIDCYEETIKHVLECCAKGIPSKIDLEHAILSLEMAIRAKDALLKNK